MLKGGYQLHIEQIDNMSYALFKEQALQKEQTLSSKTLNEIEDLFWKEPLSATRIYSVDNEFSLFGDKLLTWNMNEFSRKDSEIHGEAPHYNLQVSIKEI